MLKSLELFGFKSFADRTRFDFTEGITCIVGPNGSGKSNIVDAIKWILGDQSPKSLRGKEMSDVIFNGSAGRKPSSFAEALMTFDNSSAILRIDTHEVQIGRRLWRSGDSEYLINNAPVRLRDIRDLFLGTGATTSAYNIIEQGRVDQILQAGVSARRAVFEEAAGVSRYQVRKTEALRKLERVSHNILRLTDIVDEIETQLNATRSQAVKATKYRELSEQLRTLWLGFAADEHRLLTRQLDEVDRTVAAAQQQILGLREQQKAREDALAAIDNTSGNIDEQLRHLEQQNATHREGIAGHKSTIRHETVRLEELNSEQERLRKQRMTLVARSQQAVCELQHSASELEQFQQVFDNQQVSLLARDTQIREVMARIEAERLQQKQDLDRQPRCLERITDCHNRLAALQSELQACQKTVEDLAEKKTELEQLLTKARKDLVRQQAQKDEISSQFNILDRRLQEQRTQHDRALDDHAESQSNLAQLRERKSALVARQAVLEDLERRQEGLGLGVKEILSRAHSSDYPPWNHILGSVADLLQVDLEDAAFLEVALGNRSQFLVLDDLTPLVDYLNDQVPTFSGRVGFITLPEITATPRNTDGNPSGPEPTRSSSGLRRSRNPDADIAELAGVIKRVDELVDSSESPAGLAEHLLSDTWIVDTLDRAMELSRGRGRGCRFVTLQGELLESDGTLFAGSDVGESAVISRKSELRQLRQELLQLDHAVDDEERRLCDLDDSLKQLRQALVAVENERQEARDKLAQQTATTTHQRQELEQLTRQYTDIDRQSVNIATQHDHTSAELTNAQMDLAAAEEEHRELQHQIESRERVVSQQEHRRQTLQQAHSEEKLDLAKQEERLNNLRNAFARLEKESQQWIDQDQEAERRFQAARAKNCQITLNILNANALVAELSLEAERLSQSIIEHTRQKALLRKEREELVGEENQLRQRQRHIEKELHAAEIQARDLRHQVRTNELRIEEEYQVRLADVVESGASATRDLLEQQAEKSAQENGAVRLDRRPQSNIPSVLGEESAHDEKASIIGSAANENGRTVGTSSIAESQAPEKHTPDSFRNDSSQHIPLTDSEPETQFEHVREELERRLDRLRRKQKLMGSVNTDSLDDLDELEKRYSHLSSQLQDLVEAKATLEEIVRKINGESKRMFVESFNSIRGHFQEIYRKLFAGGEGDIILEDANDVLDCGIDIVARPPGKELRSISLLSGGEKTLTAVALLLAVFKSHPSPFCVLDEVDAALDEANIERYTAIVKEFESATQFVVVTHSKRTMTVANVLYGVTMQQSGVSKKMSIRFEDVGEDGEIRVNQSSLTNTPVKYDSDAA